jgi:hypothetical protein
MYIDSSVTMRERTGAMNSLRATVASILARRVSLEVVDHLDVLLLLVDAACEHDSEREGAGQALQRGLHDAPLSRNKRATLPDIPRRA